ncbi:hypothetical protein T439DRAFT_320104 [Meredithblackwellia eburnea MCA 4105]
MGAQSTPDPYQAYQDTAQLCVHVITTLFTPTPTPPPPPPANVGLDTPPHSPTIASKNSPPQLAEFIAYALYRTRLPPSIIHQALLLLHRLKSRYPSARGTSTSPHRLFLSSLMLSSKISMDDTYSNKSWQIVGQGLFSLREVNQMERELFAFLGWNVVVRDEELLAWVHDIVEPFEAERRGAPIRKSMEDRRRRRDSVRQPSSSESESVTVVDQQQQQPVASTSRSPSPCSNAESRHRRASDAAVALLHGGSFPSSSSSNTTLNTTTTTTTTTSSSSSRTRRSRTRTPESRPSPYYSSRPGSTSCSSSSCSSSTMSSPAMSCMSGITTPGTPGTPMSIGGPMTPESAAPASVVVVPGWASEYSMMHNGKGEGDKLGAAGASDGVWRHGHDPVVRVDPVVQGDGCW